MPLTVSGLVRYPLKSAAGQDLTSATVEPWGLAGDRRWMVTTPDGEMVSAREQPRLLAVAAAPSDDGTTLTLTAPGSDPLAVAVPAPAPTRTAHVWGSEVAATPADDAACAWVSALLGAPSVLLHLDDPTRRPSDPYFSAPGDRVSFADGYALHVTTEASLTALNHHVADGPRAETEWPVAMGRFRPNLVVEGGEAWDEDTWKVIRVGGPDGVVFRGVKGCARCVMTTTDPATGAVGREPLGTLVRHRRWDGQSWFGMNLVPDVADRVDGAPTLRIGDEVEVLERHDGLDGPPRRR